MKDGRCDRLANQQLSVSVQVRVTGRCPRKKKAQSGGRITRCKAQPVDLLFSSKLSISRSASTFSLVGVDNLSLRLLVRQHVDIKTALQ